MVEGCDGFEGGGHHYFELFRHLPTEAEKNYETCRLG
jgi:hypothetical protein